MEGHMKLVVGDNTDTTTDDKHICKKVVDVNKNIKENLKVNERESGKVNIEDGIQENILINTEENGNGKSNMHENVEIDEGSSSSESLFEHTYDRNWNMQVKVGSDTVSMHDIWEEIFQMCTQGNADVNMGRDVEPCIGIDIIEGEYDRKYSGNH